jgi:hypothetical protein
MVKETRMKLVLLAMITCASAAALGQAGGSISGDAAPLQITGHPQHATFGTMATAQTLVGGPSDGMSAHGERPLWEFGPISQPVPLGDVARAYRKEKQTAKKAEFVLEKQGS